MRIAGREVPDWAVYGGIGLVGAGGFYLYKKRQSAKASAANSGSVSTAGSSAGTAATSVNQQPSIVPYYLTSGTGQPRGTYGSSQGGGVASNGNPLPVPSGVPGGGNILSDQNNILTPAPAPSLPSPPVPAPTPPAPAPAPAPSAGPTPQQNNNIPADLLAKITANGEHIVSSLASPNGGVWYLGSKGGVFAINSPFYGAPAGQSYWGNRTALQIVPNGNGYTVIDSTGSRYNYGG